MKTMFYCLGSSGCWKGIVNIAKLKEFCFLFFFSPGQQKKNPSSRRSMSLKLIFYYIIWYLYFNCLSTWIFKTAQFFTAKIPNRVWSFSQQRASRHQQLEAFQPRNCFYTASSQWDEQCCSEFQATQVGWEAVSAKLVKSSPGWS